MVRKLVIAVDESTHSRLAVDFALQHVVGRPMAPLQFHLVTVLPPIAHTMAPAAPLATAAAMNAIQHQWESQRHQAEQQAQELLRKLADALVMDYKVPHDCVHLHMLPALGGASGVGESLVQAAKKLHAGLLVLGTRGMGSIKSSFMSFLGLGSVSDYCLHNANLPVLVVRQDKGKELVPGAEATPPGPGMAPKKVMISTDDSPHSQFALSWYLDKAVMPHDQLHLVSVALAPPLPILDEPAAVAAAERMQHDEETQATLALAREVVAKAAEQAQKHGVLRTKIISSVLTPEDGASDIGQALCHYAKDKGIDLAVVGSRGLGSWQRSLLGALGLGSVSDYMVHHLPCPLVVVKEDPSGEANNTHDDSMLLSRLDEETAPTSKDE